MKQERYRLFYCRRCGWGVCAFLDSDINQRYEKSRQYPNCPYCKIRGTGVYSSASGKPFMLEIREPVVPRKPISKEIRKTVLERDGYMCLMCGSTENLQLDHIIPVSDNGDTSIENLQTLCRSCNSQKGPHNSLDSTEGRRTQWSPGSDWAVARRLINTLNRHGFTNKDIAEITGLPQQSVTKLANRGHGRYETVKAIEQLAIKAMPELKALMRFVEESKAEAAALVL